MQYEFLVGEPPEVVDIVPQREPVEISGRAVNFPANTGREADLDDLGDRRRHRRPRSATSPTPPSSSAPTASSARSSSRPAPTTSTRSPADAVAGDPPPLPPALRAQQQPRAPAVLTARRRHPRQHQHRRRPHRRSSSSACASGTREGDRDVAASISVDGGEPVDAITDFVGNGTIGLHVHDDAATPGETTLGPLPYFSEPALPERHRRVPARLPRRKRHDHRHQPAARRRRPTPDAQRAELAVQRRTPSASCSATGTSTSPHDQRPSRDPGRRPQPASLRRVSASSCSVSENIRSMDEAPDLTRRRLLASVPLSALVRGWRLLRLWTERDRARRP